MQVCILMFPILLRFFSLLPGHLRKKSEGLLSKSSGFFVHIYDFDIQRSISLCLMCKVVRFLAELGDTSPVLIYKHILLAYPCSADTDDLIE